MGSSKPKISESGRKKLNNSITRIQINEKNGTGFFMKIEINGKEKNYLITHNQIISQEQIDSKINIDLIYEQAFKTISLDKNIRNIRTFENGVIIIEIIQKDKILEDKYLHLDLNYKKGYEINTRVNTIGYNNNYKEKEISTGEITSINAPNFRVNFNANLGSPICSFENQYVIGIYKKDNNGIFIKEVIDSFLKENDKKMNRLRFYYFDENKEKYIFFYNNVLKFHNQNNDFDRALLDLETYLLDIKDNNIKNIIDILRNFKNFQNIENNDEILQNSIGVQGFLDKMNTIIRMNDNDLSEKFYYFIDIFLKVIEQANCKIQSEIELFRGATMDYNRLLEYKNNKNKLIFYIGFCPATKVTAAAAVFGRAIGNTNDFNVIERIKYKYKREWKANCYDFTKYDTFREMQTYLFTLFTCFKIKDVIIKESNKTAEILLESVGIKIDENLTHINNIIYNENQSVLEFV
jgi:hypothetical protein